MASNVTHHALDIPIYGAAYNVPLVWLDADGDPTLPVSLDIEVSKDNGTFANATNTAVLAKEVGGVTDSAYGYVTLTAAEMTCDVLLGQAKDSTQKATPFTLRPKRLPVVRDSQCTAGGNSTATLDASASAVDDYYNGCILFLDADTGVGQARRILSYVGSTKVATIAGTWETNPDVTTDYQVLATPEWLTALNTRAILALPAVAPAASGGLPTFGTGAGQLNVSGGRADADLLYLKGYALTEAAGAGKIAAALSYFLDVATPALTAAVGSAAIADAIWDEVLSGHTGAGAAGTALETLTTLGARTNNKTLNALLGIPDTAGHTALTDLADALWDEVLSGHAGAGAAGTALEVLTTLGARTNNKTLNGLLGIPDTAAHTLLTDIAAGNVTNVTGTVAGFTAAAKAEIESEVNDALIVLKLNKLWQTAMGTDYPVDGSLLDFISTINWNGWDGWDRDDDTLQGIGENLIDAITRIGAVTGAALQGQEAYSLTGLLRLALLKTALTPPTALGGTFNPATDSLEAQVDVGVNIKAMDDGVITAAKIADNAIDDAALAADTDVYEARVTLFVDDANAEDSYAVGFFKNGVAVTSGITVPVLTVYQMNVAGTVLVNGKTLLQAGALGFYYYDTTTECSSAGVAYMAKVTATIDGSSRTMTCPVGRDSSA